MGNGESEDELQAVDGRDALQGYEMSAMRHDLQAGREEGGRDRASLCCWLSVHLGSLQATLNSWESHQEESLEKGLGTVWCRPCSCACVVDGLGRVEPRLHQRLP